MLFMKNLTCTTCGSNRFREEEKHYICEYCGAVKVKSGTAQPTKRNLLITGILIVLLIGGIMGYRLLYSVKSDLTHLTQQQSVPSPSTDRSSISLVQLSDQNPYADTILKVEGDFHRHDRGNALEKAIKRYQKLETHKAFYLSLGKSGAYAFGLSHSAKSTRSAEKEALAKCETEKRKHKLSDTCIPYGVDNHISRLLIERH